MRATLSPGSAAARVADADSLRRIDWRFLLPTPQLGRLLFVGPADSPLLGALREYEEAVVAHVRGGAIPTWHHGELFGVCVVESEDLADVERAAPLVRPGGWMYWESYSRGPLMRRRRALVRAGMRYVSAAWHRPSFEVCQSIIPLDSHAPVRHFFRGRARRLPAWLEGISARTFVAGLQLGFPAAVSFVAQRAIAHPGNVP